MMRGSRGWVLWAVGSLGGCISAPPVDSAGTAGDAGTATDADDGGGEFHGTGDAGVGDEGAEHADDTDAESDAADADGETTGPGMVDDALYVAPDGDDDNPGTLDAPFGTLTRAIEEVAPGETIFMRGGTYVLSTAVVLDHSGTEDAPIRLWAYGDETPVLDFSENPRHVDPPQPREDDTIASTSQAVGIFVPSGSDWWHVRGLTIRNAAYYGVRIYGSHNTFEQLTLHDNKASGLEITGKEGFSPSNNLVLNCDSFHNFDPQSNGEDADGFAAKFDTLGPGNRFVGTRAWSNSDDGYDFWHAAPVTLEDCWAFDNGFNRPEWADQLTGAYSGDGMGFKLGQDAGEIVLHRVVAWSNKGFGIDDNGNGSVGGVTVYNATLVNNAKDGNPVQIDLSDGRPHTVRNTVAFDVDGAAVANLTGPVDEAANSWNGVGASAADFVDLDPDALWEAGTGPRGPGGALPTIGLRLTPASALVDAGTDVGLPYAGDAPDLGAFESE